VLQLCDPAHAILVQMGRARGTDVGRRLPQRPEPRGMRVVPGKRGRSRRSRPAGVVESAATSAAASWHWMDASCGSVLSKLAGSSSLTNRRATRGGSAAGQARIVSVLQQPNGLLVVQELEGPPRCSRRPLSRRRTAMLNNGSSALAKKCRRLRLRPARIRRSARCSDSARGHVSSSPIDVAARTVPLGLLGLAGSSRGPFRSLCGSIG
jgi:hypothetical protein